MEKYNRKDDIVTVFYLFYSLLLSTASSFFSIRNNIPFPIIASGKLFCNLIYNLICDYALKQKSDLRAKKKSEKIFRLSNLLY